jgi:hypothetical protein
MASIFEEVRNGVTIAQAIDYLGLQATETKGDQLRFGCPKCGGTDRRTLSINLQKGFRCFAGDKKGDDATALVAHVRGIRNGEAAQQLKDHFLHSSTKPKPEKAKAKGRSDQPQGEVRPLELLGISNDLADRLQIQVEDGRVLFEQRDEHGTKLGTLALATRDDLPLVEWIGETEVKTPSSLQGLWRVVKGGLTTTPAQMRGLFLRDTSPHGSHGQQRSIGLACVILPVCKMGILFNPEDAMPAHCMTLTQRQDLFDGFRTAFYGGRIELNREVEELDSRIRGRLLLAIACFSRFHKESDHSNGSFRFGGWIVTFEIHDELNGLVMLVGLEEPV